MVMDRAGNVYSPVQFCVAMGLVCTQSWSGWARELLAVIEGAVSSLPPCSVLNAAPLI